MSAEPTVSLREHLERQIADLEKRIDQRATLVIAANDRERIVLNERLAGMNEFRGQLRDQASAFATRELVDQRFAAAREAIEKLEKANAAHEAKIAANRALMAVATAVLLFLQVLFEFLTRR